MEPGKGGRREDFFLGRPEKIPEAQTGASLQVEEGAAARTQ
jgi:hypothetical protein